MTLSILLDSFPAFSETFLYTTIHNWEKAGMQVDILARKRGDANQTIPFKAKVAYLPSESAPAPLKLLTVIFFFLKLCLSPKKLNSALKSLRSANSPRQALQLAARFFPLYARQTDLIYFPFGGLAVKYLEYIENTDARVVFSLRGSDIHVEPLLSSTYRARLQAALGAADGVHCVCHEIEEKARALNPSAKLQVIYTALAPEFLQPDFASQKKQPDTAINIFSVGRLDWKRGFEHGMVAAQELKQRGINFRWSIIGAGEYRQPLQWAIRDMNLEKHVFLLGAMKHNELRQALRQADIFFHPSVTEGISNAVLEAMALGLPVVACDIGGMREAIPADEYGILVPPRDWKKMADALETLARNDHAREQIGIAARDFVRARFTEKNQTEGFLALFEQSSKRGKS